MDTQEHELGTEQNPLPFNGNLRYHTPNDKGVAWSPDTSKYYQLPVVKPHRLADIYPFDAEQEKRIREIIHEEIKRMMENNV